MNWRIPTAEGTLQLTNTTEPDQELFVLPDGISETGKAEIQEVMGSRYLVLTAQEFVNSASAI